MLRSTTTMREPLRGTVALAVLLLAAALLGLVAPAPAAGAPGSSSVVSAERPRKASTSAWMSVNAAKRIPGEKVKLSAHVYPEMRRKVVVQRKLGKRGKWTNFVSGRTTAKGELAREFKATTQDARFRVVVPAAKRGSTRYAAARSKVLKVKSVEQEARLTMRVSSGGELIEASVWAAPFRKKRPVRIQVLSDTWRTIALGELDEKGQEEFTFLRVASGAYTFRAVVQQWRGAPKVVSPHRRIVITTPRDRTPPPKPQSLRAEPGDGSVELVWNKVDARDFAAYLVYMRSSASSTWNTLVVDKNVGYLRVTKLGNGTRYEFKVTAVDRYGNESGFSNTVRATPKGSATPPPPAGHGGGPGGGSGGDVPISVPGPGKPGSILDQWLELFPWLPLLPFWPYP